MKTKIPRHLHQKATRELESGERIKWIDMPALRFFTPKSTAMFLFAIPWTAFAFFWMFGAAGFQIPNLSDGIDFFPLFGIPFVLIGFGMLLSPVWTYRNAKKTVYVITNRRAILFDGGRSTTIRSYTPDRLLNIYRKEGKNGIGDVIIDLDSHRNSDGELRSEELGFFRISNAKEVERKLRKLVEDAAYEQERI